MLPNFNRPLPEARQSNIAARKAQRLSDRAERLLRDAKQLREIDGDDAGAAALENEAQGLQQDAQEQIKTANAYQKKASAKATIAAIAASPFNALGTYARQQYESGIAAVNPFNRFQGLVAALTPFTGAFSRQKAALMGGAGQTSDPIFAPIALVAKRLDETNTSLLTIARFQPKLLTVQQETKGAVDRDQTATRDVESKTVVVIKTLGEIKDLLSGRGDDGMSNDPLWSPTPKPSGGGGPAGIGSLYRAPPQLTGPPAFKMITGPPSDARGFMAGNQSVLKLLKDQNSTLLEILKTDKEQLKEMNEGDETRRLLDARARDEQSPRGFGSFAGIPTVGGREQGGGGGIGGGGIMGTIGRVGGAITAAVGAVLGSRFLGPLARTLGPLASRLGLGRTGAALTSFGARGAARGAAQAAAGGAARTVAGRVVAGAAARGAGRLALRAVPIIGSAIGVGAGAVSAWQQARRGNWGGAALSAAGGVASLFGPWGALAGAGLIGASEAGVFDTSRPVRGDQRAAALRRAQQAQGPNAAQDYRPAPTIITNNYNQAAAQSGPVIAQVGKTIIERSRGEMFSYIA